MFRLKLEPYSEKYDSALQTSIHGSQENMRRINEYNLVETPILNFILSRHICGGWGVVKKIRIQIHSQLYVSLTLK